MALVQEIQVPLIAVNDTRITVLELLFENGRPVKKGDVVLVFETSKTTYDVIAESDGFIQYNCSAGTDYEVNETVARIFSEPAEAETAPVPLIGNSKKMVAVAAATVWEGDTVFSPGADRLIDSLGISRELFKGRDFVSRRDVEELADGPGAPGKKRPSSTKKEQAVSRALPVDPDKVELEKLSSGKKKEIEYLGEVQSPGLISTISINVETKGIFVPINRSLQFFKNSLLPVTVYEAARLLEKYRSLNAYYAGDGIAYYKNVNIGFAIDIGKGLKVLKVAAASAKTIHAIEADIMRLSNAYLDDQLALDDLTDVTFTITDLSAEGVSSFRPLVNMMNSGILGISAIDEQLQRCTFDLTFDHRVTEGKLVARFLKELKERLQSYRSDDNAALFKAISCYKCLKSPGEDLAQVGFIRCITPAGEEGYICQTCLNGF